MLDLIDQPPFPTLSYVHRFPSGQTVNVCVLKMQLHVDAGGAISIARAQSGPRLAATYYAESATSSLKYETDLCPFKQSGEFYVVDAEAGNQDHSEFRTLIASIRFGRLTNRVRVTGPRVWKKQLLGGWSLTSPQLTASVPLQFEYAFGQTRTDGQTPDAPNFDCNPVGRSHRMPCSSEENHRQIPGHQLERVDGRRMVPASFSAIDRAWSGRNEFLGTIDDDWKENVWPRLPRDFDYRYFSCAPKEQQLPDGEFFRGDETIEVSNCKTTGWTKAKLPDLDGFVLSTWNGSGEMEATSMNLDTAVINLKLSQIDLTWRCWVPNQENSQPALLTSRSTLDAMVKSRSSENG